MRLSELARTFSGMGSEPAALPQPRFGTTLRCARCGGGLVYMRQDRFRGVREHCYVCPQCGQRHAAWEMGWQPGRENAGEHR